MPNYTKKADTLGVLLRPERRHKRRALASPARVFLRAIVIGLVSYFNITFHIYGDIHSFYLHATYELI